MFLRSKTRLSPWLLSALPALLLAPQAHAQQPAPPPPQAYPPQQPPPAQPYPQQQPPPQGYAPQPLQPLPPAQPQPPPQAYPPQPQPPPQAYPPQQLPPPGYVQQPPPPIAAPAPAVPSTHRDDGEMAFLYATSVAWGLGTGVWIDGLANVHDPGVAVIAPAVFIAAAPIAIYLFDSNYELARGVPSSMATGLTLGAVEGIAIAGTQWQYTGNGGSGYWGFNGDATLTFALSTAGGVAGYLYGEWYQPDPRSLSFITSSAGWGALSGLFIGAGAESPTWVNGNSGNTSPATYFGDGASVGGLVGYNAGIVVSGVLTLANYVPSWRTQQAMWLGYFLGTALGSLIYFGYIGQSDAHHGMLANGFGGLAGVAVAAVVTANMKDTAKAWVPPFQIGFAPTANGGAALTAFGSW